MESDAPLIVPHSLRGWKRAERTVQDASPVALQRNSHAEDDGISATEESPHQKPCLVCRQNQSQYTCPRCNLPYCSVLCYRKHTSGEGEEGESTCTEGFYQQRVSSILQLEQAEQTGTMRQVLNRQYLARHGDRSTEEAELMTEELAELLEQLESQDDGAGMSQEELFAMMSPALQASFQNDIQSGDLHKLLLNQWHPWWKRELVAIGEEPENSSSSSSNRTLDERLLRIPKFSTIFKGPPPQLLFHLLDILYSLAWTQRLYHGFDNAIQNGLAMEASTTLLQHSSVLNCDTRHVSLEECLHHCTKASTAVYPTSGCNADWTVLAEDCALILGSHRLVGRALLDATDLLKKAIHQFKHTMDSSATEEKENGDKMQVLSRLRRIRKKLDFFLSWSQQSKRLFGEDLQNSILEWIQRWQYEVDTEDKSMPTPGLQLPEIQSATETKHKDSSPRRNEPLIVEID